MGKVMHSLGADVTHVSHNTICKPGPPYQKQHEYRKLWCPGDSGLGPGTMKLHRLIENNGAVGVELTPEDLRTIDDSASKITILGARYPEAHMKLVGR